MNITILLIAIVSSILTTLFLILFIRKSNSYKSIYNRFKDVVDIEREKEKVKNLYKNMVQEFEFKKKELTAQETQ